MSRTLPLDMGLADLAPIDRFPTVDDMHAFVHRVAAQHPGRVAVAEIGRSRAGEPLQLLTITPAQPRGSALVIGQPHPNEPIGMATVVTLVERLLASPDVVEADGIAWHFVPCADPDGTRLNEGWFAGPWTREHYARHFYRPGSEQQVEWTFPFHTADFSVDAPMPETVALMNTIDTVQPDVLVSLHNGELGGAYFYATPGADDFYPQLTQLCETFGVPLHHGDPETPLSVVLHPAVYSVPTAQQIYDMARALGADPAALVSGASSHDYAMRIKAVFGLAIELPYWRDQRAADTSPDPEGRSYRSVVLQGLELQQQSNTRLHDLLDAASPLPPSPFVDALQSFISMDEGGWMEGQRLAAETSPEFERAATVAEVFSVMDNVHMFRLRLGGMLLRAVSTDAPAHELVEATFREWAAEAAADSKAEAIPIRDLVAVQAGATLAAARHALNG